MLQKMNLHPEVELIIERLFSAGYRADVVGGAVRDHLLLRRLLFFTAKPLFQKSGSFKKKNNTHNKHGNEKQGHKKPRSRIIKASCR